MFMNLLALLALQYSLPVYGVTSLNINTTLGLVYRLINGSSPDVAQTLGIPLAAAPVEDLRFAAPAAYEARGTIDATKQGPLFPQYPLAESGHTMLSTLLAELNTPLVRFVQRAGVRSVARSSLCAAVEFPAAATELTRTCYILVS